MIAFVILKASNHRDPPEWLKSIQGKFVEVEECTDGPAYCGGKAYHIIDGSGPSDLHVCEHALEISCVGMIQ